MRPHGDHFGVRSPALLGLVADWVRAGVPVGEAFVDAAGDDHDRGVALHKGVEGLVEPESSHGIQH